MALPDYLRVQSGTVKTWKSSGGDAAITLASLANGSYRQGAKLDLGATRAEWYDVYLDIEMAATPTAGNTPGWAIISAGNTPAWSAVDTTNPGM